MTRLPSIRSNTALPRATRLLRRLSCLLPLLSTTALGMDQDTQLWLNVTAIGRIGTTDPTPSRWRYWLEGQARFDQDVERNFQNIVRPALGFDLTPRVTVWAGTAWIGTETRTGHRDEHRPWQQMTWTPESQPAGFTLQLRPRLEQRMLQGSGDTGWRFRQFFRGIRRVEGTAWSVVWQDEVFLNLNRTDYGARGGFDQNRLFLGVAYHATPVARLEMGYLNQFIPGHQRPDTMNHILGVTLFLTP